jgi:hypothetical protein
MIQEAQTATASFFVPVVVGYASAFLGLEGASRFARSVWPAADTARSRSPRLDLGIALLVATAIIGLGSLWTNGALRWHWPGDWDHAAYALAQLAIWSPLPLALWLRRQRAASAWTGADHLAPRLAIGLLLGCVAVTFCLAARGELSRWPAIVAKAFTWHSLAHAAPVYLEGVGIAYIYVRLQWVVGTWVAALIPALLFAIAHVPQALAAGESAGSIAMFFGFNVVFVTTLLLALGRYRDVVSLGVVHFCMDLATGAF